LVHQLSLWVVFLNVLLAQALNTPLHTAAAAGFPQARSAGLLYTLPQRPTFSGIILWASISSITICLLAWEGA
jgi:hypothetical protein